MRAQSTGSDGAAKGALVATEAIREWGLWRVRQLQVTRENRTMQRVLLFTRLSPSNHP